MSKTLVAVFDSQTYAEKAAKQIEQRGLRTDDISIVARHNDPDGKNGEFTNTLEPKVRNDNISDGALTGGLLGGLAGLLIGAGSMVIPGLGIIAAAGPITGLISGAVTGGVVGGLVDLGIPENRSYQYETSIKEGKLLFTMKVDEPHVDDVSSILRSNGAISIDTY